MVAIERLSRPEKCGDCHDWQGTGKLLYNKPTGDCQRPYPANMPYKPFEDAPPLLLCEGVKRNASPLKENTARGA